MQMLICLFLKYLTAIPALNTCTQEMPKPVVLFVKLKEYKLLCCDLVFCRRFVIVIPMVRRFILVIHGGKLNPASAFSYF